MALSLAVSILSNALASFVQAEPFHFDPVVSTIILEAVLGDLAFNVGQAKAFLLVCFYIPIHTFTLI